MIIEVGKEEVVQYNYGCDLCENVSSYQITCSICDRDICHNCTKFDPRDIEEYPRRYCNHCFSVGHKYLGIISREQEKFDVLVEGLEQEWRDEAIGLIKKNKR